MNSPVIACPSCHALVRVPAGRLAEDPKCPRCKSQALSTRPVALDTASFDAHTAQADFPVVVDFWAPWCGPCRMMAPHLDRLADEARTRVQVAKVNTDEQPQLAAKFGIRSIPTLILFRHGVEVARQSGAQDYGSLTRWVDAALDREDAKLSA
jgi:thioredoxin 2